MSASITIETDLFEHRHVKPHFINPCCFGEDFAAWLGQRLSSLAKHGFSFSEPIQEDYGWGLWARSGNDRFWLALSYVGEGPQEEPAEWVVSIDHRRRLNPISWFLGRNRTHSLDMLRDCVWQAVKDDPSIIVLDESPL